MTAGIDVIFSTLDKQGDLSRKNLVGCTPEEIMAVRAHFAHKLPFAYEEFLRLAGNGAGKLFRGSEIYYPRLLGLQNAAEERLRENGGTLSIPDDAMVFFMHQGYEFCFLVPSAEDPPVHQYVEGQAGFSTPWDKFTEFLKDAIAGHLKEWPDLNP